LAFLMAVSYLAHDGRQLLFFFAFPFLRFSRAITIFLA
jgi:hypothetical protein